MCSVSTGRYGLLLSFIFDICCPKYVPWEPLQVIVLIKFEDCLIFSHWKVLPAYWVGGGFCFVLVFYNVKVEMLDLPESRMRPRHSEKQ